MLSRSERCFRDFSGFWYICAGFTEWGGVDFLSLPTQKLSGRMRTARNFARQLDAPGASPRMPSVQQLSSRVHAVLHGSTLVNTPTKNFLLVFCETFTFYSRQNCCEYFSGETAKKKIKEYLKCASKWCLMFLDFLWCFAWFGLWRLKCEKKFVEAVWCPWSLKS